MVENGGECRKNSGKQQNMVEESAGGGGKDRMAGGAQSFTRMYEKSFRKPVFAFVLSLVGGPARVDYQEPRMRQDSKT